METPFTEDMEIGEKQDVEVFQVPAQDDVNATESYHDFKKVSSILTLLGAISFCIFKTTAALLKTKQLLYFTKCFKELQVFQPVHPSLSVQSTCMIQYRMCNKHSNNAL